MLARARGVHKGVKTVFGRPLWATQECSPTPQRPRLGLLVRGTFPVCFTFGHLHLALQFMCTQVDPSVSGGCSLANLYLHVV